MMINGTVVLNYTITVSIKEKSPRICLEAINVALKMLMSIIGIIIMFDEKKIIITFESST